MITSVGSGITPVFTSYQRKITGYQKNPRPTQTEDTGDRLELSQTNPADDKALTEEQRRQKLVNKYIEEHCSEIRLRTYKPRKSNSQNTKADVNTPLGVLVKKCGDNLDEISKEYGTTGLAMYVNLAEIKPKETRSVMERIKPDELVSYFERSQYKNLDWMRPEELVYYHLQPQNKQTDPNFNPLLLKYGNNLMNYLNPDVSYTNTTSQGNGSNAQRERILNVQDYFKTRTPKRVENRTKSEFTYKDDDTELNILVAKCGDDISKIDKEFGLKGLKTYMFDKKPDAEQSVKTQIGCFLLDNCRNGKHIHINKIYDNFGDFGMRIYDNEYSSLMNDIHGDRVTIDNPEVYSVIESSKNLAAFATFLKNVSNIHNDEQ